jgi:hypothetical protein
MKLYYAPGACSLASRISLHEVGLEADFERVDLKTKITEHGYDFNAIERGPHACGAKSGPGVSTKRIGIIRPRML